VEACVLAGAAWPLVRLGASRRLAQAFPRAWAAAAGAGVVWLAAAGALAAWAPVALHVLSALALVVLVAGAARARPGFGRSRRLPPGSLSLSRSILALADRRFYQRQAERHGPVFKAAQFHRGAVCVVGLERGHRLLRENADAITSSPLPFSREISGGFLRFMDDETYAVYGPLLRKSLARSVIAPTAPLAAEVARRELARMADAGPVPPGPYFRRAVHDTFVRAFFGLSPGTVEHDRFAAAYAPLDAHDLPEPLTPGAKEALVALRAQLGELPQEDDAPVCSLRELRRLDPAMPDATCLDNLLLTLKISTGNVVGLLHWLVATLGREPAWQERIRSANGAARENGKPDVVERVMMETLRLGQSEYIYRSATREIDYDGFRIPRGWLVRLCVWESHRDPAVFRDPETFDPDRFLERTYDPSEYAPFGWGPHACNGVPLVSMACKALLGELAAGYDWTVTGAEPAERDFRHWNHWRPNSNLRLRLAPRA
jgi:cytochrome P450